MFSIGEYVIHRSGGICKVKDIAPLAMEGASDKDYYFLIPINEHGSEIFTPAEEQNDNMRPVLTEKEAWKLIEEIPNIEEIIIQDDKQRDARYKEAIRSCDCKELVSMIKTLYFRRKKRLEEGKKTTATDDRYFKLAEDNLYSELAFAIGREKSEMQALIASRVQ